MDPIKVYRLGDGPWRCYFCGRDVYAQAHRDGCAQHGRTPATPATVVGTCAGF